MPAHQRIRPPTVQSRRSRLRAVLGAVIVLVLVVGAAFIGVLKFLSSKSATVPVAVEAVSSPGANPFMTAAGTDLAVTPPAGAAPSAAGASTGLYGAIRNSSSCNTPAIVDYLGGNNAKASAWAGVVGIAVAGIPGYLAELTPAILRTDTYATNPGFRLGQGTATISVLQAGTAVLVDKVGIPRVKCYSGNPLTPASLPKSPTFIGTSWPDFATDKITVIEPNAEPVDAFTMVNPLNGEVIERPVGTAGATDRVITPARVEQPAATSPPPRAPAPPVGVARPPARVNPAAGQAPAAEQPPAAPAPAQPPPPTTREPLLPLL